MVHVTFANRAELRKRWNFYLRLSAKRFAEKHIILFSLAATFEPFSNRAGAMHDERAERTSS